MSERLRSAHEIDLPQHESIERERNLAKHHEKAAENARNVHEDSIDKILKTIEKEAETTEDIKKHHLPKNEKAPDTTFVIGSELRDRTLHQEIKHIQKQLPPLQKSFSKVVHNPVIDTLSEVSSKTLGRPSGLLSGGAASLIVSSLALFISRYYGYRYNFLVGLLAFVGGFFLGLLIESLLHLTGRKKGLN